MSERVSKRPALFRLPRSGESGPRLLLGRCRCGHVFFPPQRYGCERCGAGPEALDVLEAPARGALRSAACLHRGRSDEGPRAVGTVVLDAGPALEAPLDEPPPEPLPEDARAEGVLVETGEEAEGARVVDLRFRVEVPAP